MTTHAYTKTTAGTTGRGWAYTGALLGGAVPVAADAAGGAGRGRAPAPGRGGGGPAPAGGGGPPPPRQARRQACCQAGPATRGPPARLGGQGGQGRRPDARRHRRRDRRQGRRV